jgi:hypothetical protein
MRTYRFSFGNSTDGPIGMTANVLANSKGEALAKLRGALQDATGSCGEISVAKSGPGIEYINVYISPEHVGLSHIDQQ